MMNGGYRTQPAASRRMIASITAIPSGLSLRQECGEVLAARLVEEFARFAGDLFQRFEAVRTKPGLKTAMFFTRPSQAAPRSCRCMAAAIPRARIATEGSDKPVGTPASRSRSRRVVFMQWQ